MDIQKKLAYDLVEAEKKARNADHLLSVTLPIIKDARLLVRVLELLHSAFVKGISIALKWEHIHGRVRLSHESEKNLKVFFAMCGKRYGLDEEKEQTIRRVFALAKQHQESSMEFVRQGRIVMLAEEKTEEVSIEDLKAAIRACKVLLEHAQEHLKGL